MADERLFNPATRIYLAFPQAFADWQNPTTAELNANPDNDPTGLIFNITCAVNQDGTTFDLGDSDTDDSLSFCQVAGAVNATTFNPDIVFEIFRATVEESLLDPTKLNTASLAFDLLYQPDIEFFAILSVGEEPKAEFEVNDRVKLAKVSTDYPVDTFGTGEKVRFTQNFNNRGDVNWNFKVAA